MVIHSEDANENKLRILIIGKREELGEGRCRGWGGGGGRAGGKQGWGGGEGGNGGGGASENEMCPKEEAALSASVSLCCSVEPAQE